MRSRPGSPPPVPADQVTEPDQLDPGARDQLDLLPGEHLRRCWRTAHGFLVLTNLRVTGITRRAQLFDSPVWRAGPSFLFYNCRPPRVVLGRFLELSEELTENAGASRYLVHDPETVRREIEQERVAGRLAWEERRQAALAARGRLSEPMVPPGTTVVREVVRTVVKVRCRYCGNLMDETLDRCPFCAAPQQ
jgi:hypothetical protein